MRWLRLAAPAALVAAWMAGSVAQQPGSPPAGAAPTPPASTPQPSTPQPSTPRPAAPPEQEEAAPSAPGEDAEDSVDTSTELQPDAAVTFPVDI